MAAKADTIDYWTVRFRGKVVLSCNVHTGKAVLHLKRADLRADDSLQVFHFNDTPCPESMPRLRLGQTAPPLTLAAARGDFSPLVFSAGTLLKWADISGQKELAVYRDETAAGCTGPNVSPTYLFTIQLE